MRQRTLKDRFWLSIAKWMLVYLEHRIAKCKRRIADDKEMQSRLCLAGADEWMPEWAKPDPAYWKARIAEHRKLLHATREFILREGLGR